MVSSKVMALMLSEARMASLSARVGSSLLGTLADRMTHISHRLTLTARRSALLNGDPYNHKYLFHFVQGILKVHTLSTEILGKF
jgi:hypothetical protein